MNYCVNPTKFQVKIVMTRRIRVFMENFKTRLKILPVLTREHYTSLLHWV
jgi:hypothetical protein